MIESTQWIFISPLPVCCVKVLFPYALKGSLLLGIPLFYTLGAIQERDKYLGVLLEDLIVQFQKELLEEELDRFLFERTTSQIVWRKATLTILDWVYSTNKV